MDKVAIASYCASPSITEDCIKICSNVAASGIGIRAGSYMQAVSFFCLTLLSPEEEGAESVWVGLSISLGLIVSAFIELAQTHVTAQTCWVIFLLSMLPYVSTLSAMNSKASYRQLGTFGMLMLQTAIVFKSVLSIILWIILLYTFYNGQLPGWTHMTLAQPTCIKNTRVVVFFKAITPTDENTSLRDGLMIFYTIVWMLILFSGIWWAFRAPSYVDVLHRHWVRSLKQTIRHKKGDPITYKSDTSEDETWMQMTLHSIAKGPEPRIAAGDADTPKAKEPTPSIASSMTMVAPSEHTVDGMSATDIKYTHKYYIWPFVAIFLAINIINIELQVHLNDIFPGEEDWDFPGILTFILALPTSWAVIRRLLKLMIRERDVAFGKRENFFEEGKSTSVLRHRRSDREHQERRRGPRRSRSHSRMSDANDSDATSDQVFEQSSRRGY